MNPTPIAKAVPSTTPIERLRSLSARYANPSDPAIRALPTTYRSAIEARLCLLIADSQARGARP